MYFGDLMTTTLHNHLKTAIEAMKKHGYQLRAIDINDDMDFINKDGDVLKLPKTGDDVISKEYQDEDTFPSIKKEELLKFTNKITKSINRYDGYSKRSLNFTVHFIKAPKSKAVATQYATVDVVRTTFRGLPKLEVSSIISTNKKDQKSIRKVYTEKRKLL